MTATANAHFGPNAPKLAGILYFSIAVCGGFSIGLVPSLIVIPGDAATTLDNMMNQSTLFRTGVLADVVIIVLEMVLSVILFSMFRAAHPTLSMIALLSRVAMAFVMGLNLIFWVVPFGMATGGFPALSENLADTWSITSRFIEMHRMGVYVWQVFFGLHLLALGWMVIASSHIPSLLGRGLFIGAFGYLFQAVVEVLYVDASLADITVIALLIIVTVSEISFAIWLLIYGNKRFSSDMSNTSKGL